MEIMKKKIFKFYILGFILAAAFVACEEEKHEPIVDGGSAPQQVTDVKVIPTPGGADLVYKLPDNENLLYIEAIVNTPEGKSMKFSASSHRDTISVIGLATEKPQEVLLYSVNKGGVKSDPLSVLIDPLTPPYMKVFQSLTMSAGLGGVGIEYHNESAAELVFYIGRMINGKFVEESFKQLKQENGRYLFWGYPAQEDKFGVFIRDRWDHYSDTMYADITPILEIMIDKKNFKAIRLQNDVEYSTNNLMKPENLWDGLWSTNYTNPFAPSSYKHATFDEDVVNELPAAFTIDLGEEVTISRFVMNHYWKWDTGEGGLRKGPKLYEIYGLKEYNNDYIPYEMGAWHNWTLLAEVENVRPSSYGGTATEDAAAWEAGDVVLMSPPTELIRYVRFKSVESWDGKRNFDLAEISIFGAPFSNE